MGGACEKKQAEKPVGDNAAEALDRAGDQKTVEPGKLDTSALPGIDVSKLDADKQKLFYTLLGSLNSPCGKAHSLRTSFTTDQSCKRAPFAVRYVLAMLEDEAAEATLRDYYSSKYAPKGKVPKFDVSKAPHEGNEDAPIKIYEFYDYECPHCEHFKKEMDQVLTDKAGKVVTYFMQFPLEQRHPDSRSAAQAALAADLQGKFKPMHDKLFAETPKHTHEAVTGYAKELGLDVAKFEADYSAASGHVTLDQKQGEDAGVDSTPYIFFNNQHYSGPPLARYLEMWIDEDLAAK
jgi:protein-disulfide isomerase